MGFSVPRIVAPLHPHTPPDQRPSNRPVATVRFWKRSPIRRRPKPPPQMSTSSTQLGQDAVMTDVLAQGRAACYKARDAFYACLEEKAAEKPTEIATVGLLYPADCKAARAEFAAKCRPTWVKYFDRQYGAKRRVRRLLDDENDPRRGPISLPQTSTFKP